MANTLTNLIPEMQEALDTVSRELVGMIPAVASSMTLERVAVGQTVRSPVAPAADAADITPATNAPDTGDQVIGNKDLTISKSRGVPVRWNGEQSRGLNTSGVSRNRLMRDQFAQAMRTLTNEIETDLVGLHVNASRAYGTAATTPFGTAGNFTDASFALKILLDNGAPLSDNHLVLNTSAGANVKGFQAAANIAGTDSIQRQGILLPLAGLDLRESAQIVSTTIGTAANYVTDTGTTYVVGTTTIHVDTGTGTTVAGDTITFAGDTNKYVVSTGFAGDGDSDVVIAEPGLRKTLADGVAMTVGATAAHNMVFNRNAIILATRAPAVPEEGDSAVDVMMLQDERSGLSFEVRMYKEYRRVHYEVGIAWGFKAVKDEHIGLLLG